MTQSVLALLFKNVFLAFFLELQRLYDTNLNWQLRLLICLISFVINQPDNLVLNRNKERKHLKIYIVVLYVLKYISQKLFYLTF